MPRKNKYIFLGLALAYIVLPTDLLPDYLLLLGWLDDFAVLTLLMKGFIFSAPQELKVGFPSGGQSHKEDYGNKPDQ